MNHQYLGSPNIFFCCLIVLVLSHWVHPILSHWVSYQPRLFIAKCCCQPRWRPPTCWRWMWRWHKILMSEVAPSTAHQTLLYESSLRRTFSAPGLGMVLFSVPCGMPGNGSAIIHAHSSSRLIILGPLWSIRDIYIIHTDVRRFCNTRETFFSRLLASGFEAQIGNPRHFYNHSLSSSCPCASAQIHPGPLNIRKPSVNFILSNSGIYLDLKFEYY